VRIDANSDKEERLRELKRGFRAVSRRYERAMMARKLPRFAMIATLAVVVASAVAWGFIKSPWPFASTVAHIMSVPNCAAARAVDLAPAKKGQPGYWGRHDRDGDGLACEPWPKPN
jgi:hypothetical protein